MSTSTKNWLDEIAEERPIEETLAKYDQWAPTYEQDAVSGGVAGAVATCKFICSLNLSKDATILDAGAGTGRLGKLLKSEGFQNLHAHDGSGEMLKLAKEAGCYKSFTQGILGEGHRTTLPDDKFDAVVMVSVFSPGHFGVDVLPELLRITKPGGIVCWGQRDPTMYAHRSKLYEGDSFHKSVVEVCKGCSCVIERDRVPLPMYFKETIGHGYVIRKK